MFSKVLLDMDGVLYAWNKGVAKMFNINYDNKAIQEEFSGDYEGLESHIGHDAVEKGIREAGPDFWKNLEQLPWANEVFKAVENIAGFNNICFCTSFGKWPEAAPAKLEVLKRDFNIKTEQVIFAKAKHLLARGSSYLIDDKLSNVREFRDAGGPAILWPNEFSILSGKVDLVGQLDKMKHEIQGLVNSYG